MVKLLWFCFIVNILHNFLCDANDNSKIFILNQNNFKQFLTQNEYVFVKFYAPWCQHSKAMKLEFIKASEEAAKLQLPVKFAEVDCEEEKELCKKYKVEGYPSLLLLRRKASLKYDGPRTSRKFNTFLKNQVRPAVRQLNTADDAEKLFNDKEFAIVGFFKNQTSPQANNYINIADNFATPTFAITSSENLFRKYNVDPPSIVLFKRDDKHIYVFDENLTLDNLRKFIKLEAIPLLIKLDMSTMGEYLQFIKKDYLVICLSFASENFENVINMAEPLAKKFKETMQFFLLDVDQEYSDFPFKHGDAIVITQAKHEYQWQNALSHDNLTMFIDLVIKNESG